MQSNCFPLYKYLHAKLACTAVIKGQQKQDQHSGRASRVSERDRQEQGGGGGFSPVIIDY